MFALHLSLKEVQDHGRTSFVDELNERLYLLLVRNIAPAMGSDKTLL